MGITWSLLLPSNLRGLPGNEVMVLYESWPPIPGDLGTGNILRPGWRVCFWRARHPTMDMPRLTPLSSFTIHTSTFSQSWSTIRTFLHQQARGPRGHPGTPRGPKNPGFLDQESIPCAWFSASCRAFCGSNAWTATQIFSCREDLQVNLQTSGCPNFPGLILKKTKSGTLHTKNDHNFGMPDTFRPHWICVCVSPLILFTIHTPCALSRTGALVNAIAPARLLSKCILL
jgi:hypothetical protein